jgi:hypothetical protein
MSADRTTEELVRAVLDLIEDGQSETSACATVGVPRSTFRSMALRVDAGDQYARALEGLARDQVEKIELAIDDMRAGVIDASKARVEIDARKWLASKFLPRTYGSKVAHEISGRNGEPLDLGNHEVGARLAAILEAARRRAADRDE